ncbi:MAG: PQQ-like beta-propeller repeat protein [Planctomycetaceae bacterium]|nr:PQQ-like beta-propeller repeat protein [Planctomycetaceae bacterium]
MLLVTACGQARGGVVEYTNRSEWEAAVKHVTAIRYANEKVEKNVPLNAGLITVTATGPGWVSIGPAKDGTMSLTGSGTTAPWFRHSVTINGGKVCAVGWDWSHSGNPGMYKSVLTHDGGTIENVWSKNDPAKKSGFLGYIDTKGKSISGFWFGSTGGCNFTGATVENICLSNLQPPPGLDSVPPEWAAFNIEFKATWDETLTTNMQRWQKELADSSTLAPALKSYLASNTDAMRFILGLRKIALLKAMVERFPDDKPKHAEAYKTIARTSREIILPWWPDPETSPLGVLNPPDRNPEVTLRWQALTGVAKSIEPSETIHPDDVQGILNLLGHADAYIEISPSLHSSYASAISGVLAKLSPQQLARLRTAQEEHAARFTTEFRRLGDFDETVKLSRRDAWAPSVHALLLELAEQALQQGRCQWALASINDVLNHSCDAQTLLHARALHWAALVQQGNSDTLLAASMAAVPDDTQLPWRGGKAAAGEIKKALLSAGASGAVKLAGLARRTVQLPAGWPGDEPTPDGPRQDFGLHSARPINQVQATGDGLFVLSAARVARFNADGSGPAWTCAPSEPAGALWSAAAAATYIKTVPQGARFDRRPVAAHCGRSPALSGDGRVVYCLMPAAAITAFDAATGKPLWCSDARDDWRDFVPMSRPVADGACVYVLTTPTGLGVDAGQGPGKEAGAAVLWRLVCADGRDGRVLWRRSLGWQPYTLRDVARGASGVAIRNGAIFCSTSMGIVARCDARDGAVDWVRAYGSTVDVDPQSETFAREGSPPLAVGNTLLVAARDHSGVMAYRCDSGQYLWETIGVPSDRLIGAVGNVLLTINQRRLCALDIASGRTLWSREFPEGTGCQGAIVGGDLIIPSAGKLHRIAAATGATIETIDLVQLNPSQTVLLEDGTVLQVKTP